MLSNCPFSSYLSGQQQDCGAAWLRCWVASEPSRRFLFPSASFSALRAMSSPPAHCNGVTTKGRVCRCLRFVLPDPASLTPGQRKICNTCQHSKGLHPAPAGVAAANPTGISNILKNWKPSGSLSSGLKTNSKTALSKTAVGLKSGKSKSSVHLPLKPTSLSLLTRSAHRRSSLPAPPSSN
jgi:hypothetical protein